MRYCIIGILLLLLDYYGVLVSSYYTPEPTEPTDPAEPTEPTGSADPRRHVIERLAYDTYYEMLDVGIDVTLCIGQSL